MIREYLKNKIPVVRAENHKFAKEIFEMKKIGLGIAILLFALVFNSCSSGMDLVALGVGVIGLVFSIMGFLDKKN